MLCWGKEREINTHFMEFSIKKKYILHGIKCLEWNLLWHTHTHNLFLLTVKVEKWT